MRGLKYIIRNKVNITHEVAPHVGAWIEIHNGLKTRLNFKVAPHVGAWIEIIDEELEEINTKSHLT